MAKMDIQEGKRQPRDEGGVVSTSGYKALKANTLPVFITHLNVKQEI